MTTIYDLEKQMLDVKGSLAVIKSLQYKISDLESEIETLKSGATAAKIGNVSKELAELKKSGKGLVDIEQLQAWYDAAVKNTHQKSMQSAHEMDANLVKLVIERIEQERSEVDKTIKATTGSFAAEAAQTKGLIAQTSIDAVEILTALSYKYGNQ